MGMMIGQHCPSCKKYIDQVALVKGNKCGCPFCKRTGEFYSDYTLGKLVWTWNEDEEKEE